MASDINGMTKYFVPPFAEADGFRFRGAGMYGTATAGQVSNIDFKILEERYINGAELILKDQAFWDSLCFQVVDVDNILGYGAGTVLDEFGTNWCVSDTNQIQSPVILPYPAKVLTNLYVRIKYTSTGGTNVSVKCNLHLHKKT